MIIDRIKVSIEGYGIWAGMEASISPDENPVDAWVELKEKVKLAMESSDSMKGTTVVKLVDKAREDEINKEFEAAKERVVKAKTKELAEAIIIETGFTFNIELKEIANSKTSKSKNHGKESKK